MVFCSNKLFKIMDDNDQQISSSGDDKNGLSDIVGHSPTMSDHDGQRPTLSPTENWLTTEEIVLRLADQFGVKRDRRSAERYCQKGKIKAFFDDAQNIWFAEQGSVDLLGAQLKEIQDRREETVGVSSDDKSKSQRANEQTNQNLKQTVDTDGDGVYELRAKVTQLETEVKVKSELINHLQTAREKDRDRFIELASETGEVKAEVKHLQAMLQITDGSEKSGNSDTIGSEKIISHDPANDQPEDSYPDQE